MASSSTTPSPSPSRPLSANSSADTLREITPVATPRNPEKIPEVDYYLVSLAPDDPANPSSWSAPRKWMMTMLGGVLVLNVTFASSAPSGIVPDLMREFTFSQEIGTLVVALFVAGFCVGPILWGPLSEEFGRRPIFFVSIAGFGLFQVAMALAKNTGSLLAFRFLGGIFAAGPLTNSGALISDMWDNKHRGNALAFFVLAPFAGPALGPTVGGFISVSPASWRWLFWTLSMFAGVCWVLIVALIPETYMPILRVNKAKALRKSTGDDRYYAPMERTTKTLTQQVEHVLLRPFKMLIQEPMMMATTVYMSFIYGCLYLLFEAYPIVFGHGHHFSAGITGLMFMPVLGGAAIAVLVYIFVFDPMYQRQIVKHAPNPVPAEERLHMALYGAPLFAIAFFWFGWTSYPSVNYWAPMLAGLFIGFGNVAIYLAFFNYIIDTYLAVAASALAANTICRSVLGAVFPLFATQMYNGMNPQWASTLVGFVALALVPIPFIFLKHGAALRAKSKHAPAPSPVLGSAPFKNSSESV